MSRHVWRAVAAAACVGAAVVLVLLALDARAWSSRIAADDLRYTRDPSAPHLWQPRQLAPFGLARSILGIGDDLAYRRALREFRIARPLDSLFTTESTRHQIQAELDLTKLVDARGDTARRAQAANLLGILGFSLSMQQSAQPVSSDTAVTAFRRAVGIDPQNDDALFNLEYALDSQKANGGEGGQKSRSGRGSGAGLTDAGHGY